MFNNELRNKKPHGRQKAVIIVIESKRYFVTVSFFAENLKRLIIKIIKAMFELFIKLSFALSRSPVLASVQRMYDTSSNCLRHREYGPNLSVLKTTKKKKKCSKNYNVFRSIVFNYKINWNFKIMIWCRDDGINWHAYLLWLNYSF